MIRKLIPIFILLFWTPGLIATELRFNTRDFFPFSYQVNQRVSGPVADIIREICKNIDVSCSFKLLDWTLAQKEVKDGKVDGLFVVGWNKQRADWLLFSPQILKTEYGFFVAANSAIQFKENRDIAGLRVGVYGPSNTSRLLEKIQDKISRDKTLQPIQIDMWSEEKALFKDLNSSNRTLTAIYANKDVGHAIKKNLGLINVLYAGTQKKRDYFIGFNKKNMDRKLLFRFNSAFVKLYKSGKIKKIANFYNIEQGVIEPHIINFYSQ